ncbi:isoprenyl transferase [bacterium]|nr:isoprenyl transferase [bacterium]MCP5462965.1 isoprenyl transferase [bacterium]
MKKEGFKSKKPTCNMPVHIAIIMDGNGRWAKQRGYSRIKGHQAGAESIREVLKTCGELGIRYLTLFAFSTENWARPKLEVNQLMKLLERYLKQQSNVFYENNIRFNVIGAIEGLPYSVQEIIEKTIDGTKSHTGLTLTLALNYSGRSEIVMAVRELAKSVQCGDLPPYSITESVFSQFLYTKDMPDPDLLIRTSGEMRISNFLLWQISYSELSITPVLWPDFRKEHLLEAIKDYQKRERRYGKV